MDATPDAHLSGPATLWSSHLRGLRKRGDDGRLRRLTTFGTRLYAKTRDLRLVQRALGHRSVVTTQIYTHLVDGEMEAEIEGMG